MSSNEQLATFNAQAAAMLTAFSNEYDRWESGTNLSLERLGDTRREFYLDQVNGNDANDGTQANPIQSLSRINELSVYGGIAHVRVVGNYQVRERISMRPGTMVLRGNGGTLSFADDSSNSSGDHPGFVVNRGVVPGFNLVVDDFTLSLPADPGEEGIIINTGFAVIILKDVTISLETTDPTRIISSGSGALGIVTSSVVLPSEMPGRWVESVAAGEAPGTAKRVAFSSLETL